MGTWNRRAYGLEKWRRGETKLYIIDWEFAGWAPFPWDALKATWLCVEEDDEWQKLVKSIFPDSCEYLDADWQWRSKGYVTLL